MRDREIDGLKGWLIMLVVLGHVLGGASHLATGLNFEVTRYFFFIIYAFHMPAFFFIVGMMWHDCDFTGFIKKRMIRLLVPYFVVGLVSIFIYNAFMKSGGVSTEVFTDQYYAQTIRNSGALVGNILSLLHAGGWPNELGFKYNTVLWFLPCMFVVQIAYWAINRWLKSKLAQFAIAIAFVGLSWGIAEHGELASLPWGLSLMPKYIVYVILGRWLGKAFKTEYGRGWTVVALVVLSVLVGVIKYRWIIVGITAHCLLIIMALSGIYLSFRIVQAMPETAMRAFERMGLFSMGIMLWHKFIVVALQFKMPPCTTLYSLGVAGFIVANILITAIAVVGPLLACDCWRKTTCAFREKIKQMRVSGHES